MPEPYVNEYASVSRLKLWETCRLQFWHRYINKTPTSPQDKEAAEFGKVLHATNEAVYQAVVSEEFEGRLRPEI